MKHFDRLAMDDEDFIFQVGTLSGQIRSPPSPDLRRSTC